jgi:hypothetical protein
MNADLILVWRDSEGNPNETTVGEARSMVRRAERTLHDDGTLWTTAERELLEDGLEHFASLLLSVELDLLAATPAERILRFNPLEGS